MCAARNQGALIRRVAGVSLVLATFLPAPAQANPLSVLAKAAKLARLAKGASGAAKAAKAAKAAGIAKASPAVKTALLAGGGSLAAERAGLLFAGIPEDAARAVAYVAREGDGAFRTVLRSGEQSTVAVEELGGAVRALKPAEGSGVDIYLELSAAQHPEKLPLPATGERWFVLDASGKPHPIRPAAGPEGLERVVDVGGDAIDLADFATAALDEAEEETEDEPPVWFYGAFGAVVIAGTVVAIRRRRRRTG